MSGAGNHAPCSVAPVIGTPGRAESDLRLLGGLLGESAHIRGKLSSGLLEQIGRAQNEGEVRTIPKLLSAELPPLESVKGALSEAELTLLKMAFILASCAAQSCLLFARLIASFAFATFVAKPRPAARTGPGPLATGDAGTKFTFGNGAFASGEPSEARCARARRQYSTDRSENRSSPRPARYFISARQRSPFASFQASAR